MLAAPDASTAQARRYPEAAAEAARYALLRRLAPSIRHHLVVNLQPIGMIYEVLDRRLRASEPKLEGVRESAQKIHGFARAALDSSVDVVSWLAPDESLTCRLHEVARECAALLASSLSFRGYALRNEIAAVERPVLRCAVRHLLVASILHVTDELAPPAELAIACDDEPAGARITLAVRHTDGDKGFVHEPAYRTLRWDDVLALAEAENAQARREPDGTLHLLLPWAA